MNTDTQVLALIFFELLLMAMQAALAGAVKTILDPGRSAVVAGGDDVAIFDDDDTHGLSKTIGAILDNVRKAQKIFFPRWSFIDIFHSQIVSQMSMEG